MGLVIDSLSPDELKGIAKEISNIFDKFNTLPCSEDFGMLTGLNEDKQDNLLTIIESQKRTNLQRNESTNVFDEEIIELYDELITTYRSYFLQVKPKLYYDDICSKNVMIHEGKFNGLVDLDFLIKGDYLEAIGRMISVWHGTEYGEIYIQEMIKLQRLDEFHQKIIKVYAILNLIGWTSEAGIKFNGNSTGEVNWENVERNTKRIKSIYRSIN